MAYKIYVRLDDWDNSIEEYDGVIYEDKDEALKEYRKAEEYLDVFIEEV